MNFRSGGKQNNAFKNIILPWLRLIRLPNLFTAGGDSLAGACIASLISGIALSFNPLADAVICSILLYSFGLIQNDICDFAEDSRLRTERPLPSKQISRFAARIGAVICAATALLLAALNGQRTLIVCVVLLLLITAYNMFAKKNLMQGSLTMGLCRGMNMILGASTVALPLSIIIPIAGVTAFITFVTILADGENRRQIPDKTVFLPALSFAVAWLAALPFIPWEALKTGFFPSLGFILAAAGWSFISAWLIYDRSVKPAAMQQFIGRQIGCLIPWQAAWIAMSCTNSFATLAIIALLLWLLFTYLGRFIRQS